MRNKGLIATIVVMSAVIITLIAALLLMQLPTAFSFDDVKDLFVRKTTEVAKETTADVIETSETIEIEEEKLNTGSKTYTSNNGRININYPEISGMKDKDLQDKINNKIKVNATSIISLYPISTALQNLDIEYDIKHLSEDYITITYEGRVVGINSTPTNKNTKNSTGSSSKSSNSSDPYLDGFVDPLKVFGGSTVAPQNNISLPSVNALPMPTQNEVQVYDNSASATVRRPDDHASAADGGPTVSEIKSPTSPRNSLISEDKIATNNPSPTANIVSNETYPYNNGNVYNPPVYGHTSTSASTIDQKIFYTNTIDLKTGIDLTLKDYVTDFDALAKYARSSDVEFVNIDDNNKAEVRKYIRRTIQSTLKNYLENYSDFRNEGITNWPKHFSYRDDDGTIYFTIKLSSKLGNYAIIKYNK